MKMQRRPLGAAPTAWEVYRARKSLGCSRSLGWIMQVFVQLWLFFGRSSCQFFRVSSAIWYRAARQRSEDVHGMSCAGSAKGHWFCAFCGQQWRWNSGNNRLLAPGSYAQESVFEKYRFATSGDMPPEVENELAFLKGCIAITELAEMNASTVDADVLMELVFRMNEKVSQKISRGISEVEVFKCKDISADIEFRNMRLACENMRHSFRCVGGVFKAINVSGKDVPEVDAENLDFLLDAIASTLDMENKQPTRRAEKKVKGGLLESDVVKLCRDLAAFKL